jgi:hypothetical protein
MDQRDSDRVAASLRSASLEDTAAVASPGARVRDWGFIYWRIDVEWVALPLHSALWSQPVPN